jgi:hypothetical protein
MKKISERRIKSDSPKISMDEFGFNYSDSTWTLTNKVSSVADKPITISWSTLNKKLNDSHSELLKKFTAGIILGLCGNYAPLTISMKVVFLKRVLLNIQLAGCEHISQFESGEILRILKENAMSGRTLKQQTVRGWVSTINQMHRMKNFTHMCFSGPPISKKQTERLVARLPENGYWEAPPERVCIDLLRESIQFLDRHSGRIIDFYHLYASAIESALSLGINTKKPVAEYVDKRIPVQDYRALLATINSCKDWAPTAISVAKLIKHVFTACFVVITYTCGQRVSEIRRADSLCVRNQTHENGIDYFYYHAPRSKSRYSRATNLSEGIAEANEPWILSPAAVKAFRTLVNLSKPARVKSGVDNLWLTPYGNALWPFNPRKGFTVISNLSINVRLNKLSSFLKISELTQWQGRLHSHMGRKHFARFIAKRDRSMLGDLALQYSHMSGDSVDVSYARPDSEFRRLVQEEMGNEILQVGAMLLADDHDSIYTAEKGRRVRKFLGELRSAKDIKVLLGAGTQLLPCQWGVCLYSEETSACEGSKLRPNIEKRTPLVCAECSNFLATSKHALWWTEFQDDCKNILTQSKIPSQTRLLLAERLNTAKVIIAKIGGAIS